MKDKFEREIDYLRVSVTDNCNLRCVYCMKEKENNFLKNDEKLTDDEIYKIVKESAKLGIKKIRIKFSINIIIALIVTLGTFLSMLLLLFFYYLFLLTLIYYTLLLQHHYNK